jgi:hypothetical protein
MTGLHVPVLAAVSDFIILIVFGLIWAGGWVIRQVNEQQKKAAAKGGDRPETSREQRLQQLATQRLAQLRQMAEQDGEPSANVDATSQVDRTRTRTLYERRADALQRAQGQARQARPQTGGGAELAARHARAAAAEAQEAPRVREHAQETASRQQQEQVTRQRNMDAIGRREQEMEQTRHRKRAERDARLSSGVSEVAAHSAHRADETQVHRLVADTLPGAYGLSKSTQPRLGKVLHGVSLRDAIVLKEILGPPKALRQGDELL